jgi:hypothetical protein
LFLLSCSLLYLWHGLLSLLLLKDVHPLLSKKLPANTIFLQRKTLINFIFLKITLIRLKLVNAIIAVELAPLVVQTRVAASAIDIMRVLHVLVVAVTEVFPHIL